jgi:hypothetical protein
LTSRVACVRTLVVLHVARPGECITEVVKVTVSLHLELVTIRSNPGRGHAPKRLAKGLKIATSIITTVIIIASIVASIVAAIVAAIVATTVLQSVSKRNNL